VAVHVHALVLALDARVPVPAEVANAKIIKEYFQSRSH